MVLLLGSFRLCASASTGSPSRSCFALGHQFQWEQVDSTRLAPPVLGKGGWPFGSGSLPRRGLWLRLPRTRWRCCISRSLALCRTLRVVMVVSIVGVCIVAVGGEGCVVGRVSVCLNRGRLSVQVLLLGSQAVSILGFWFGDGKVVDRLRFPWRRGACHDHDTEPARVGGVCLRADGIYCRILKSIGANRISKPLRKIFS